MQKLNTILEKLKGLFESTCIAVAVIRFTLPSHSSNFWIFSQGNHWKINNIDYLCFEVFLRGHHQCDIISNFHPYKFSHSKNIQAWIWLWTLQWRKLQLTWVQMPFLYLPKTYRFRKSIVYILLVGNQWTSLCNVIMLHVNIFPYIFRVLHIPHICESLSANLIPIISKWKKITQLFILILDSQHKLHMKYVLFF